MNGEMSHNVSTGPALHHEWIESRQPGEGNATLTLAITQLKLILETSGRTCIKM